MGNKIKDILAKLGEIDFGDKKKRTGPTKDVFEIVESYDKFGSFFKNKKYKDLSKNPFLHEHITQKIETIHMAENEAIANIKDIIEKAIISKDKEIKKEELRPLYRKLKDLYQSRLLIIYFLDDISAITAKWKIKSFNDTFLQFLMVFNGKFGSNRDITNKAFKLLEKFQEKTINSDMLKEQLKGSGKLFFDSIPAQTVYYQHILGLLGKGKDEDNKKINEEEFKGYVEQFPRSLETEMRQKLYNGLEKGGKIINNGQKIKYDPYIFESGSWNRENTLLEGSIGYNRVREFALQKESNIPENYFKTAKRFYDFLRHQPINGFKMIPIIDENHPTQKKYVNASLEEILEENKSGIKVVFYIPDRDVSIVLSNKYGIASMVAKGNLKENKNFKNMVDQLKKEIQENGGEFVANKKNGYGISNATGFSEFLKTNLGAIRVNSRGQYKSKELAIDKRLVRLMETISKISSKEIKSTLGKY